VNFHYFRDVITVNSRCRVCLCSCRRTVPKDSTVSTPGYDLPRIWYVRWSGVPFRSYRYTRIGGA